MELPFIDTELLEDGQYKTINGINYVWVKHAIYHTDNGERFYTIMTKPDFTAESDDNSSPSLNFSYFPGEKALKFSSLWEADGVNAKINCENTKESEFFLTKIAKAYNNVIPEHVSESNMQINTIEDID